MKNRKTKVLLLRNIVWALVIFVLCVMPAEDIPDPHLHIPHLDKLVHFGMFFIMAVLLCNELEYQTRMTMRKIYLTTVCITLIYGGVIELLQEHFFNRSGDVVDLLADVFGAIIGCLAYPVVQRMKRRFFN